jgi:hypothetical protein
METVPLVFKAAFGLLTGLATWLFYQATHSS